jgi:hypothetical protein
MSADTEEGIERALDASSDHIVKNFSGQVFAIGDLHGDLNQTYKALSLIGAIDSNHKWIGHCIIVVQTGDQIDRGDDDKQVLDVLEKLAVDAKKHESRLIVLNGNHELMNAKLDLRYTSKKSNEAFGEFKNNPYLEAHKIHKKTPPVLAWAADLLNDNEQSHFARRAAAFAPGSLYANRLAHRSFYAIVNDTVFVHGGILPEHVTYGLEKFNQELARFFTKGEPLDRSMDGMSGPLWLRDYSEPENSEPSKKDCMHLKSALELLGAKRMVVGHSIQNDINSACDARVWRIDIGMSRAYGNRNVEVLEIDGAKTKVHKSAN